MSELSSLSPIGYPNFHVAIEMALQSAPILVAQPPFDMSLFTDKPDDYPIELEPCEPAPNQVICPTGNTEVMREIYRAFDEVTGLHTPQEHIDHSVAHEGQHGYAARQLGAVSLHCGLEIWRVSMPGRREPAIATRPAFIDSGRSTTKLEAALVAAYPEKLSFSDEQKITALGYTLDDLVRIAHGRNARRPAGQQLPVPLSYA